MTAPSDNWHSCQGEVQDLVAHLHDGTATRRRKRRAASLLSALSVLLLAVMAYQFSPSAKADVRPISCATVLSQTDQIIAGTLDSEMQDRVDAHLAYCQPCQIHVEQARRTVADDNAISFIALASR